VSPGRRGIPFALKVVVSLLLLAFAFSRVDLEAIVRLFATANVPLLLVGTAAVVGQAALQTWRWAILLGSQGFFPGYWILLRINLVGGFINLFAPSTVGGDAYRMVQTRGYAGGLGGAVPSILLDRGLGLLALVVIGACGLAALYSPGDLIWVVASLLVLVFGGYVFAVGPLTSLLRKGAARLAPRFAGVVEQIGVLLRPSWRLLAVALLSLVFQLNTVWIAWIYSVATAITADPSQLLVIIPVVYLVEMIPISANGVGVREGTLTVLFGQIGLVPEHGLVLGLTISALRYVAGLPGGAFLLADLLRTHPAASPDRPDLGP